MFLVIVILVVIVVFVEEMVFLVLALGISFAKVP